MKITATPKTLNPKTPHRQLYAALQQINGSAFCRVDVQRYAPNVPRGTVNSFLRELVETGTYRKLPGSGRTAYPYFQLIAGKPPETCQAGKGTVCSAVFALLKSTIGSLSLEKIQTLVRQKNPDAQDSSIKGILCSWTAAGFVVKNIQGFALTDKKAATYPTVAYPKRHRQNRG